MAQRKDEPHIARVCWNGLAQAAASVAQGRRVAAVKARRPVECEAHFR